MKKAILVIICMILSLSLISCAGGNSTDASAEPEEKAAPIEIVAASAPNPNLQPEVISLDEEAAPLDGINAKIIGATFDQSTGDYIKDSFFGNGLVNSTIADAGSRGFAIGFQNGDDEVKKMDAYLFLYVEYSFDEEVSQRDSVKPNMDITITDDQGTELALLYDSSEDDYINLQAPYAQLMFKAYYDSKDFNININGKEYHLAASILQPK